MGNSAIDGEISYQGGKSEKFNYIESRDWPGFMNEDLRLIKKGLEMKMTER
jgi:hypothetical protein